MLLFYYFFNIKIKTTYIGIIITLSIIIGKLKLVLLPFNIFGEQLGGSAALKAISYIEKTENLDTLNKLSIFGLVKRFLLLILFLVNRDKIIRYSNKYNIIFNGYILGIAFYFLFADSLLIMINRGSLYFNVCEPFLLSYQLIFIRSKIIKFLILFLFIIMSIVFFFQSISPYPDLFLPYKGLFMNSDYSRIMY